MKKKFITTCFICIAIVAFAKNIVEEIAWVVGDEPIYKSEIEEQYMQMQSEREAIDGDPYCVIPERMAIEKLFLHQAKIDTILPNETMVNSEVDARLNELINSYGSREKAEEYLRKSIPEIKETMRQYVRNRYTVQQVQSKLTENVKATPADVRKFYSTLSEDEIQYIPRQVVVKIITINPIIPASEIDEVKSRLREFANRVNSGETEFSVLARLYSEDPGSARFGGELGFSGKSSWAPEFSAVAFNLNDPKKASKIVETEYGYHIIQLIEKRGDKANFRHILLKPKVSDKDLTDAINALDTIKTAIQDGKITFEEASYWYSHDKDSKKNHGIMLNKSDYDISTKFQLQQLPQEVAKQIANMKVGDISAPFVMVSPTTGREIVAIVKLDQDIEGHKANLSNDYQVLKEMYENQQRQKIIENWVKKKQQETYVRIEEGWRNCDFSYDGWIKQ